MAEILQLFTIQRRLYSPDAIPWAVLLAESNLQRLRERYKLKTLGQEVGPAGAIAGLTGTGGEFSASSGLQAIEQLILQPAVIHVQISGDSDVADEFVNHLIQLLCEIGNNKNILQTQETTRTYQTVAIAKLRIPFHRLFSEQLREFLTEVVRPKVVLPAGDPEILLERLSWAVRYKMDTTDFMYLPKAITIEPRQGSKPGDMIYYTVSPTQSRIHLELLETLESKLRE